MRGDRAKLLALLLLYVLIAALCYRAFRLGDPLFFSPTVDEETNLWVADQLLRGSLPPQAFWQEPVTFAYYALLLALGVSAPAAIKFFHLFVLGPVILLLLYLLARSIKPRLALPAAAIYALSPLALFMSLSLMKTPPAILLVLLMLCAFRRFYAQPRKIGRSLLFALSWLLSWGITQHVLLFLPPLFAAVARRCEGRSQAGRRNLLVAAVVTLAGVVTALSLASLVRHSPLLTLTGNGKMNFILANSRNVAKTMAIWPGPEWQYFSNLLEYGAVPSRESQISASLPGTFRGWLSLAAKKVFWEFTPHAYFRQSSWEKACAIFPPLRVHSLFTLILLLMVFQVTLAWRSRGVMVRSLIACWWLYHAVNIVFIPGIARYNAVILPLTAILALEGLRTLAWRPRQLALLPCLCLWLSQPPNGFQREYAKYMELSHALATGMMIADVPLPEGTLHAADHRQLRAAWLLDCRRCAEAETLLKQTPDWNYHGLAYCRLIASSQARQCLYFDALDTAVRCVNWPEAEYSLYVIPAIERMDKMLAAYHARRRLTPGKLAAIATFAVSLRGRYSDRAALERAILALRAWGVQPQEPR